MPRDRDRVRLLHMLEHARETMQLVEGRTRQELDTDRVLMPGRCPASRNLGRGGGKSFSRGTRQTSRHPVAGNHRPAKSAHSWVRCRGPRHRLEHRRERSPDARAASHRGSGTASLILIHGRHPSALSPISWNGFRAISVRRCRSRDSNPGCVMGTRADKINPPSGTGSKPSKKLRFLD